MKNIIIYTDKKSSAIADVVSNIEDSNVRLEDAANIKDYETLNPGVIIVESVPNIKDVLMVTKFKFPILFIGETFKGATVRAVAFDYVKTPVDNQELVVRVKNMLKIKELRDKLKTLSTTDELTGLHNRRYLLERMEQEISRAKRYSTPLSLLLFDLDFFKVVNDIYGYEWGDVLLRSIADKLKQLIRKEDIITRYGDEEFIVVLPNTSEDNKISILDDGQFLLKDGTLIIVENASQGIWVHVDLNGYKNPPNVFGYDLFTFEFRDGELRTMGDAETSYSDLDKYCNFTGTTKFNGIACAHYAKSDSEYFKRVVKEFKPKK